MWIGHVARMHVDQRQKAVMFGWIENAGAKPHAPYRQAQWINSCLKKAQIPEADWFRLAQNKTTWKKRIYEAFPQEKVNRDFEQALDQWRPGRPLPNFVPTSQIVEDDQSADGSEQEVDAADPAAEFVGNTGIATVKEPGNNACTKMKQDNGLVQCAQKPLLNPTRPHFTTKSTTQSQTPAW